MSNVFDPTWDAEVDRPPYRWRRSRIGRRAASDVSMRLSYVPGPRAVQPGGKCQRYEPVM